MDRKQGRGGRVSGSNLGNKSKKRKVGSRATLIESLETRTLLTASNPNVIDLFMAYTTTARTQVGSQALMVDKINRAVSFLNQAMANSKVNVAVRLVGTMEANYTETGSGSTDLGRLTNLTDGQLDDVTNAAVAAGADVTDLVVATSDVGGITQGNYNIDYLPFLDNGVFSHEFGHSLGGNHQHGVGEDGQHSPADAYEGTLNFNGNVLNGAIGGGLPYYSNPNVSFRGVPTGIAGTGPTAANNARVMNSNAAAVSGFRAQVVPDTTGPVAQISTVSSPIGGNTLRFLVRYGDGSGVNVDSLGNGNITVTGPNGFSAPATLVSVDDPSMNYAYHVATYQVTTPSAITDPNAYSYAMNANSVSDTVGNFTPAGPVTTANTPLLPVYADTDPSLSSDEGDLAGRNVSLSTEIGNKYQMGFIGNPKFMFSLSSASTLVLSSNLPANYRPQLFRDVNGDLQLDQSELIVPSSAGVYANLPAGGNYYINVQVYAGGPVFGDVNLKASFQSPGAVVLPPSSLSGVAYTDTNANGKQDAGEPTLANIPVNLSGTDNTGKAVNVTVNTDANGVFKFTNLRPSDGKNDYKLVEKPPSNITPTVAIPGSLGGIAFPNGETWYVSVGAGVDGTGYFIGNAPPIANASLSGSVYFDANNNGQRDPGEQGLAGVAINLGSGNPSNSTNVDVKTDANGNYTFTNIAPDFYNISETQPAGVLDGITSAGSLGGDTSLANLIQLIPVKGVNGTAYNFGELSLPATPPAPPTTTDQTNTTPQGTPTGGNVITAPATITPVFDFSNGFSTSAGQITYNGNAKLTGNLAQIIPQAIGQVGSLYYSTKVNVAKFTTQFNLNTTASANSADGLTFVVQNSGVNAIGGGGGSLGYQDLGKSVAIKFDLYNNSGEGTNSTGIYISGASPGAVGSIDLTPSGINLHNGNTIQVMVTYDGTNLSVTVKDPTTGATATQKYPIDIPATVGGSTAFVGFTGGSGGATALETVSGWTYAAQSAAAPAATPAAAPFALAAAAAPAVYAQLIPNTGPFHASSFTLNRDGSYNYVPVDGFIGTDSFTYQIVDSNGRVAAAKVSLVVTHVDQVPTMQTEMVHSIYVPQGGTINIDLAGMMTDDDSSKLSYKLGDVDGGTAKLLKDGHTVQFTAWKQYFGVASFEYSCNDGQATSWMTMMLCVTQTPKTPVATDVYAKTLPSTAVEIDALSADTDPEGMHLCLQSVDQPANGTAYIDTRGTADPSDDVIVYRPNFGFHGTDTFNYTILDFYGTPATGSVTVKVTPGAGLGIDPSDSTLSALDIYGTSGNDTISIADKKGLVAVTMNGVLLGKFAPTGLIAAFGANGNDTIDASGTSKTVLLFGDDGNDTLTGGSGKSILIGGAGRDALYGGSGNSDIITGIADYDDKGFTPLLSLFNTATTLDGYLHDDGVVDQVFGGSGNDTFWAKLTGKGSLDILHNRRPGETVFPLK